MFSIVAFLTLGITGLGFLTYFVSEAKAYDNNSFSIQSYDVEGSALVFDPIAELEYTHDHLKDFLPDGTHLPTLAYAIAWQETHDCRLGYGASHNNCMGIMWWPDGVRTPVKYNSKEDSYNAFYELWKRKYKKFPDIHLAKKWSGSDRSEAWLKNVYYTYNK